jgi:RNA polymerase sigma-70 factor (ECF subfamily)
MHDSQSKLIPHANQNFDVQVLIDKYQIKIWRYLRALGCDETLADDLTQDTFVAVLRRPFEIVNDAATAVYLKRVSYHLLVDYRRRSKRMIVTEDIDLRDRMWVRWIGENGEEEIFEYLKSCYERLTDRAKLALQLRFREGASREKIADELAISTNGAKNLMQRAKAQLKECIESRVLARQKVK